jgi:MATE family multidrug resistance protein
MYDQLVEIGRKIRKIGWPLAFSGSLEMLGFMAEAFIAAALGAIALASFQITINVAGLFFMIAIGLASATSVRVGFAVGRGNTYGQWQAGIIGMGLVSFIGIFVSIFILSLPDFIASLYTNEPKALELASDSLFIFGLFFPITVPTMVAIMAQRSLGYVWTPLIITLVCTWGVGVPIAAYMALVLDYGLPGMFAGFSAGGVLNVICNGIRFHIVAQKPVKAL